MNGNRAVMIHVVSHEHLIIFQLFDSGNICFHSSGRRFYRELHYLGPACVRILSHLWKYRIPKFLAYLAQRVGRGYPDAADIIRRVGIMDPAGNGWKQRQRSFRFYRRHQKRLCLIQLAGQFLRRVVGRLPQFFKERDLPLPVHPCGVYHILPSG